MVLEAVRRGLKGSHVTVPGSTARYDLVIDQVIATPDPDAPQYVLVVFNQYEESDIDGVLGPFPTMQAAHGAERPYTSDHWRRISTERLLRELPEWAR